jgi:probable rRNA maturation factor
LRIVFSYLGINKHLNLTANFRELIVLLVELEEKKLGEINIIFTNSAKLLEINRKFLNHNYHTDVITFNYSKRNSISGDIYISLEQVGINAGIYKTKLLEEAVRVIIHGILHLIGYDDKNDIDRKTIRQKEDIYLCEFSKWKSI